MKLTVILAALSVSPNYVKKIDPFLIGRFKKYLKNKPVRTKLIIPIIGSQAALALVIIFALFFLDRDKINTEQLYELLFFLILGMLFLLFAFYHYLRRLITEPITKISNAANAIGKGDFNVDLSLSGSDEIGRLAKDIEKMSISIKRKVNYQKKLLEKNKEIQKKKDEFLGIASHELRTPLTSVKAYIQILDKTLKKNGDMKTQELVRRADSYLDKLNSLIIGLLDTSRVQAGKFKLDKTEFDFDGMLKESVEDASFFTSKHKLKIEGKATTKIFADKLRLEQVYFNLISNAIKYSPDSKKIIIGVKRNGRSIFSYVQDFGIGIPQKEMSKVFERFYRLEEPERFSGLGLGLYISNQIVKRHGGRMWVKSKKDLGSTFYFLIPILSE